MSFDLLISLYGSIVGFVVGLVGGGGSVLGVPILTYFAGVSSTHIAIGTSAVTVGVSASLNLILHSRARNVDWRIAYMFSASGVLGVMLGNQLGSGLIDHIQKITVAAMQIADMKVCAHRS